MKRSLTKAVVNIVTMQLRIALIQPAMWFNLDRRHAELMQPDAFNQKLIL